MTNQADHTTTTGIVHSDAETCLLFLDVPGSKVVLFQAFFELYEGLGTVRTIDIRRSEVMIITTPSCLDEVIMLLAEIKNLVPWRFISTPQDFKLENIVEH